MGNSRNKKGKMYCSQCTVNSPVLRSSVSQLKSQARRKAVPVGMPVGYSNRNTPCWGGLNSSPKQWIWKRSLGYILLKMYTTESSSEEKLRVRCPSHLAGCLSVANAISSGQRGSCTEGEYTLILSPDRHFFDKCLELWAASEECLLKCPLSKTTRSDLKTGTVDELLLLITVSVIAFKSSKDQFCVITKYKMKRKESKSKAPIHGNGEVGRGRRVSDAPTFLSVSGQMPLEAVWAGSQCRGCFLLPWSRAPKCEVTSECQILAHFG